MMQKSRSAVAPSLDKFGLNLLDPHDRLGRKSLYITLLQRKAVARYLPAAGYGELAADIGCGYGRMSGSLAQLGWSTIGIDPDADLIRYARGHVSNVDFREGGLPDLPVALGALSLCLLQNVLRSLLKMDELKRFEGISRYLRPGGMLVVVDNIRLGHADFVQEDVLLKMAASEGLTLVRRVPLRAARWWPIYAIRYGCIPISWFERIADYELERCGRSDGCSRWQYYNVLYMFEKPY